MFNPGPFKLRFTVFDPEPDEICVMLAKRCGHCNGSGRAPQMGFENDLCPSCDGIGGVPTVSGRAVLNLMRHFNGAYETEMAR